MVLRVYAYFMYDLWIHKPLNPQAPTIVELGDDLDFLGPSCTCTREVNRGRQVVKVSPAHRTQEWSGMATLNSESD
jgi:hypothetical protein